MKKLHPVHCSWVALLVVSYLTAGARASVVANWTFEVNTPADVSDNSNIGPISADIGVGTASGYHVNALTDWTTPAGNGSANSLSSTNWSVGDYYQFQVSTSGLQDIIISWDQTRSAAGPQLFMLQYSTNGSSFTDFGSYTLPSNNAVAWTSGSSVSTTSFSKDLSAISVIENIAGAYFRLTLSSLSAINDDGNTILVGAGGTSRVDNIVISASPLTAAVPEAGTLLIFGGFFGLYGLTGLLRDRRASAN